MLLVDDDEVVRSMIKRALLPAYVIYDAGSCKDVEALAGVHLDLAVVDYHLPDGDGLSLLDTLRVDRPGLPAIIVTAFGHEELAIKAIRAGVTDYIKKPLRLSYLRQRVAQILLGEPCREECPTVGSREAFIMEGIAEYVETHFRDDLSREKLAQLFSMDPSRLSKVFAETFGQNVRSYLNGVRMRKAAELLKDSDLSITDVALFVGYENVQHFNRVFREIHGLSPRAYRTGRAWQEKGF
jgi:YesN/AraC family two-component response regulator